MLPSLQSVTSWGSRNAVRAETWSGCVCVCGGGGGGGWEGVFLSSPLHETIPETAQNEIHRQKIRQSSGGTSDLG